MGEPRILASFVHGTLEVIDRMGPDLGVSVRASLKPDTLDDIENAWAAGWLPVSHDVELTTAFVQLVGAERACHAMRQNMADTFHKPILRPMIDGAVRIFGLSPEKLLGWAPRAWSLLFRDAGEMQVACEPGRATLVLVGLPQEVADHREYLLGTAAAISAVFDLLGVSGQCQLDEFGRGTARFELCWQQG